MQQTIRRVAADGMIADSQWALNAANLQRYNLLVIPEDMGDGLSFEMAGALSKYVENGGKVLLMKTIPTERHP